MRTQVIAVGVLAGLVLRIAAASEWSTVLPIRSSAQLTDASSAYGFCLGQDATLAAVARQHPALEPQTKLVALRFTQKTGNGCQGVADALAAYINRIGAKQSPPQSWASFKPQLEAKIRSQSAANVAAVADIQTATRFIAEVQERSTGAMDAEILRTLIAASTTFRAAPATEMLGGWKQVFRSKGHEKAADVAVQVTAPLSWRAQEANGAHIVQKWTTEVRDGPGTAMVMLSIWPTTSAELREAERDLTAADPVALAKDSLPPGAELIEARRITLFLKPGLQMTYRMKAAQLDQSLDFVTIQYQGIARGGIVVVQGQVGGPVGQLNPVSLFAHYEDVFRLVVNSLTDLRLAE